MLNTIITYSFVDYGLGAYSFTTYSESRGGLHLFSLINVPAVSILGPTGTRLTAIVLTGMTIVVTFLLVRRLYGERTALLAAAFLTISPMFQFFGTAGFPESMELFTSTAAVYAFVRYCDSDRYRWLGVSFLFLSLGILDHAWVAFVFAPLALVSLSRRDFTATGLYTAVVAGSVWVVYFLTNVRGGGSTLRAYSVFYRPEPLFDPAFYVGIAYDAIGFGLSPPLGLGVILLSVWYLLRGRHLLVASWVVASLSTVALFPRGASIHFYYLWGLLVPGSILLAVAVFDLAGRCSTRFDDYGLTYERAVSIGVTGAVGLLVLSSVIAGPLGIILPPPEGAQQLQEGSCVQKVMTDNDIESEDVAIATSLPATKKEDGSTIYLHTYLTYARLYLGAPDSPAVYETRDVALAEQPSLVIDFEDTYVANQNSTGPSPGVLLRQGGDYTTVCGTEN
ncbi:ArnT family glycosyltransferase [Halomicrobium salinisoli]|uniref:ArnT family glycosyltransferase n=1 Tax=Halomicrobium salinisoli TaxID=2878391 RepID=UPI001CF08CEE|nr:glycosyltransferase family 39 protein [Halomicrobium salinisoli]